MVSICHSLQWCVFLIAHSILGLFNIGWLTTWRSIGHGGLIIRPTLISNASWVMQQGESWTGAFHFVITGLLHLDDIPEAKFMALSGSTTWLDGQLVQPEWQELAVTIAGGAWHEKRGGELERMKGQSGWQQVQTMGFHHPYQSAIRMSSTAKVWWSPRCHV